MLPVDSIREILLTLREKIFGKKKDEGPFKANRILDTSEAKIDQVYTRGEEKPVALLTHTTEEEAKKIGAESYVGPTKFGGEGKYETNKTWYTRAWYFPDNIPGAKFDSKTSDQIIKSVEVEGTFVPRNINFEKVEGEKTFPISGSSVLTTNQSGFSAMSGSFVVSAPFGSPRHLRIMHLCPKCQAEIDVTSRFCPKCGEKLGQ